MKLRNPVVAGLISVSAVGVLVARATRAGYNSGATCETSSIPE
jgi:hypothetical protein